MGVGRGPTRSADEVVADGEDGDNETLAPSGLKKTAPAKKPTTRATTREDAIPSVAVARSERRLRPQHFAFHLAANAGLGFLRRFLQRTALAQQLARLAQVLDVRPELWVGVYVFFEHLLEGRVHRPVDVLA